MGLTARIVSRAGGEMPPEEPQAAPVRLVAKDRGMATSFGLRRLAAAPVLPAAPVARAEEEEEAAQPLRRAEEAPEEAAQPLRRAEEVEEEAQALRGETASQTQPMRAEDAVQPLRRMEDDAPEKAQPLRRAEEEEEEAQANRVAAPPAPVTRREDAPEAQPLRRAEEEAQPLRRAEAWFDAGLTPEMPADELRHDSAGASLDGSARAMRTDNAAAAVTAPAGAPPAVADRGAGVADSVPESAAQPAPPAFEAAPPAPPLMAGPAPAPAAPQAASERPRVVIDQIDVMVAAPPAPALQGASPGGARALLARRYRRGG